MKALVESGWIIAGMQALWEAAPARPGSSEMLYTSAFAEALPADPVARYAAADARFHERLRAAQRPIDPSIVYPNLYGTFFTPDEVVNEVLALERELLEQAM